LAALPPETQSFRSTHDALRAVLDAIAIRPDELATIVVAAPSALIVFDSNRRIVLASRHAEAFFGYSPGALVGETTDRLLPARLRQPDAAPMVPMVDLLQVDLPGIRQDDRELRVEWVIGSVTTETRTLFLATVRDRDVVERALEALRSSEERFRLLVDGVRDYAIFMLDAAGMVSSWNRGAERIKGWTAEEIIGQPYERFFTPEDVAAGVPRMLLASVARDEVREIEGWRVRKNGERFRASAYLAALRSTTGELYGFAKVTRDLTQKYRAEELERHLDIERAAREAAEASQRELRESEDRLRRLQVISSAMSQATTPYEVATAMLDHGIAMFGATGGAFYVLGRGGETLELVEHRGGPANLQTEFASLALDHPVPLVEAARRRSPSFFEQRSELVAAYPAFPSGIEAGAAMPLIAHAKLVGAITLNFQGPRVFPLYERSVLVTISDVCAQALERALLFIAETEARKVAEAANRSKDQFLAMLGHELRNPLAPIVTALKLLPQDETARRARDAIDRNVKHLVRLVDDLLDVSRITQRKVQLEADRVELAEIVERALELTAPLVEERGHHLEVTVPATGLPVFGDSTRLAQVIANLVNNSAKYTERGGHIAVSAALRDGDIELIVRDDGVGIDAEMLPRVFELFTQEEQSLDRSRGGLGLGLAIVRSLVAMHGGTVTAASPGRGKGSTFTITFPVTTQPAVLPVEQSKPTRSPEVQRRILVVDDNTDAAQLMAELFERSGHSIAIAHDGPSALEVAATFSPEVAILDIGLPVMDGYELARRLRQQLGTSVYLVALTGYGQASDRDRAKAAGFDVHLVKPVDPAVLRAAIAPA
jgi:PAS domain S-box-containing protein